MLEEGAGCHQQRAEGEEADVPSELVGARVHVVHAEQVVVDHALDDVENRSGRRASRPLSRLP